jgi:hypothetical protein
MLVFLTGRIFNSEVELALDGMINIQTFMTIGSGFHVYLSILRGCSFGTSDERDL